MLMMAEKRKSAVLWRGKEGKGAKSCPAAEEQFVKICSSQIAVETISKWKIPRLYQITKSPEGKKSVKHKSQFFLY